MLARRQTGDDEPVRPIVGDRVAQHRHTFGPEFAVEWRETAGEELAVVEDPEAIGGWVALVLWPELRWRERYGVHEAMDFSERAGGARMRVMAAGERERSAD
ncbi:hypothetical protein WME75_28260 [Sorangium sp. So ce1014]|uniref:hypothetical protein n=1 Tax=Sorangium sp. So ce1014 TaxID=3133326 RepID=UPI003F612332